MGSLNYLRFTYQFLSWIWILLVKSWCSFLGSLHRSWNRCLTYWPIVWSNNTEPSWTKLVNWFRSLVLGFGVWKTFEHPYTHTHTRMYVYLYIYIYRDEKRQSHHQDIDDHRWPIALVCMHASTCQTPTKTQQPVQTRDQNIRNPGEDGDLRLRLRLSSFTSLAPPEPTNPEKRRSGYWSNRLYEVLFAGCIPATQ